MKTSWPLARVILVCAVVLSAGVLLFVKPAGKDGLKKSLTAADAVEQSTGILVGDSASNVMCFTEGMGSLFVYVRLDLPRDQVQSFLQNNSQLMDLSEARGQAGLPDEILTWKTPVSWWNPAELGKPRSSTKSGVAQRDAGLWKWTCSACIGQVPGGLSRVYVLYVEQPCESEK